IPMQQMLTVRGGVHHHSSVDQRRAIREPSLRADRLHRPSGEHLPMPRREPANGVPLRHSRSPPSIRLSWQDSLPSRNPGTATPASPSSGLPFTARNSGEMNRDGRRSAGWPPFSDPTHPAFGKRPWRIDCCPVFSIRFLGADLGTWGRSGSDAVFGRRSSTQARRRYTLEPSPNDRRTDQYQAEQGESEVEKPAEESSPPPSLWADVLCTW